MAIQGPLRELALSDVLQLLDLSRKTGVLTVSADTRERAAVLHFERGAVVGARYPGHAGRLGELLLLAGKVTAAQVEGALAEQRRRPGERLGALLVEGGVVSPDDVLRQLRFQVEETVFELVRWEDGHFRFEEAPPEPAGPVALRLATEALLMEAARRLDEWTTLAAKVPHRDVVPRLVEEEPGAGAVLDLSPREWEVLAEIDGERSLQAIARGLGRGEFEVARVVFALVSDGVVEVGSRRDARPARPAAPPLPGLEEVERALRARNRALAERLLEPVARRFPDRGEVALLRGRIAAARGAWEAAVRAFEHATRLDPLLTEAYYHLGAAAVRTGELARAEEAWRTCLRLDGSEAPRAWRVRDGVAALATLRRLLEEEADR